MAPIKLYLPSMPSLCSAWATA